MIIASGLELVRAWRIDAEVAGVVVDVAGPQEEVVGAADDRDEIGLEIDRAVDLAADVRACCAVHGQVLVDEAVLSRDGFREDVRP